MTERKTLKLALEALESGAVWVAISVIKQTLAQPEQEPKVWGLPNTSGDILDVISHEQHERLEGGYTVALYTTPPQRTWVDLTPAQIEECKFQAVDGTAWSLDVDLDQYAQALQAKLKELNT